MNYQRKIQNKITDLILQYGFKDLGDLIYKREINDIVQYISIDIHKEYKRISPWYEFNRFMKLNSFFEEYYFKTDEEFEKLLNEIYERFEKVILPYYDVCVNEFSITRTMIGRVKEDTDELVDLYLQEYHQFPKDIEKLIQNVRDYYHRYKSEDEEKNKELICVVSAVYYKYLLQLPIPFEVRRGKDNLFLGLAWIEKKVLITPISIAFESFMTDDYDAFKVGHILYLPKEKMNCEEWIKTDSRFSSIIK